MLIFNTTYQVSEAQARNFLIWLTQSYIPLVMQHGALAEPHLAEVLSHKDENSRSYTLQFDVKDSATLHKWHLEQGTKMAQELIKMFHQEVVGFSTLLEKMDLN